MAPGRFRFTCREQALLPFYMMAAAALALPFIGYITDDTFIYMQFSKNLAAGHGFSFNAGEPTYGFTSSLWTILLSAGTLAGFDSLTVAKILGGLFLVASLPVFALASRHIIPSRSGRLAALAAWTANAWMVRWSLSGMETAMAVFLTLASIASWMAAGSRRKPPFLPAFLMGLAALTRPECIGLVLLAALDVLVNSGKRRLQALTALAVGFGAITIPWALYANSNFGTLLPHTVYAKGGSWSLSPASLAWAGERVTAIVCATSIIEASTVLLASAMALRALSFTCVWAWLRVRFLPISWTLSLVALYTLRGESALVSRYLLPAICWIVILGFASIGSMGIPNWYKALRDKAEASRSDRAVLRPSGPYKQPPDNLAGVEQTRKALSGDCSLSHEASNRQRSRYPEALVAWTLAAVIVIQNICMLYGINYPSAMRITRALRGPMMQVSDWIREETPPGSTIGLMDIGLVGFYGNRRVIDLHGHLDPVLLRARGGQKIEAFVTDLGFASVSRPDYVVERWVKHERPSGGDPWRDVREPVLTVTFGELGIRRRDEFLYTVYRMRWDLYDSRRGEDL